MYMHMYLYQSYRSYKRERTNTVKQQRLEICWCGATPQVYPQKHGAKEDLEIHVDIIRLLRLIGRQEGFDALTGPRDVYRRTICVPTKSVCKSIE